MSNDPRYVRIAQLRAAYDALGLDPELFESTRLIRLDPLQVVAVRSLRNDEGRFYLAADGEVASEATIAEVTYRTIPVTPHPITPDTGEATR